MSDRFSFRAFLAVGSVGGLLGMSGAWAEPLSLEAGTSLAKSSACLACHQVDSKRVGPGFRQIAQRYAGQPSAESLIVQSIYQGGSGKWGAIPMPAQRHVSKEDAARLAEWILSLKP